MKDKFNPKKWLNQTADLSETTSANQQQSDRSDHPNRAANDETKDNTELVITRIEQAMVDLTSNYSDWLNLGFAFVSEYGEAGRDYFQRISRFYPGYSATECDKKYDQCLKSNGQGITIKSFFHLAKQAGIELSMRNPMGRGYDGERERWYDGEMGRDQSLSYEVAVSNDPFAPSPRRSLAPSSSEVDHSPLDTETEHCPLPTFPESVYAELPEYLKKVVSVAESREERDMLLIGTIVVLGACMPGLFGIYNGMKVRPNLYFFLTSQASGGKGRLDLCKLLAMPIHYHLRRQYGLMMKDHEGQVREYNLDKLREPNIEKPEKPPELMLYIPANNSATGMFQLLSDNEGRGIIFETEGDTLSTAFKSDHGNYSDGFRKAFHHEGISYYRRTGHEFVEIASPCISTVLAGTPMQVSTLIPNAENGLLSRFIFYYMNSEPVWANVFEQSKDDGLDDHFNNLGAEFFKLYEAMGASDAIRFSFTTQQKEEFHVFFSQLQGKYLTLQGREYLAVIRRLGLIAFRMAMIFNALRMMETGDFSQKQECLDVDFYATLAMIKVLIRHSGHVFNQLQEEVKVIKKANKKEQFFEGLPEKFGRKEYLETAKELSIAGRTADNYIKDFCARGLIEKTQYNDYLKKVE